MESIIALDSKNCGVVGPNMKITGEKMKAQRKRLSDISNLKEQPTLQKRDTKQQPSLLMTYEYVDKLQKENMTLMKLVAERNRIIEMSGNELEKLRTNFQKLQQQNLQLAQSNSQMLAELNSGKDRLKALQHELGCKNGILMSRKLDQEIKEKSAPLQAGEVGTAECNEAEESMHTNKDTRPCKTNRSRQSKQESCGTSVLQTEVQKVEGKRPCVKRQSARFKTEEPVVATKDLAEIENSNSTDASQCKETSVVQTEVQKVEGKRPGMRRQSARFKIEEPMATKDLFEIENSHSIDASQCKETSVVQTEVQKVEGKRPCMRRQSARFKIVEPVATKDLLEIENSDSIDASQCEETSVVQIEVQKVEAEGKRPCMRRQSAIFKMEEPVATKELLEIENSHSIDASQCEETSVLQTEVQKVKSKRPCLRRQSAKFKTKERVAKTEDLFSNSTSASSLSKEVVREIVPTPVSSVEREDDGGATDKSEVQECRRTSVGRPLRRAAEKVQSYKEIPINVKMRRQV